MLTPARRRGRLRPEAPSRAGSRVFPEFPDFFASPVSRTARALLREYPGPEALRAGKKREVLAILKELELFHQRVAGS